MPKLRQVQPDAILVMDNLRPHRAATVQELLAKSGIGLIYLPRYSPEFNPIEHAWAKVKERLKAKAARTLGSPGSRAQTCPRHHHRKGCPEAGSGTTAMLYTDPQFALVLAYNKALLAQAYHTVACNAVHPVEARCCRWLLSMHDRLDPQFALITSAGER